MTVSYTVKRCTSKRNSRIQGRKVVYYVKEGEKLRRIGYGLNGLGNGHKFKSPKSIAIDYSGRLFLVDVKGIYMASAESYYTWVKLDDCNLINH